MQTIANNCKQFTLISLIFLAFSCQKTLEPLNESLESQSEQKSKEAAKTAANKSLRSRNGYLEFRTQMALDSTLKALKTLSPKQRKQWEKALDFTSLRSIFEKGLEEEESHFNRLAEEGRTPAANEHSDFVNRHQKAFVFEEDGSLLMNIFISDFSHIVNEEGIVRIAGHLFQYTNEYLKILEGGDEKKLGLLKNALTDDPQNKIKVNKVEKRSQANTKKYAARTDNFYDICNVELRSRHPAIGFTLWDAVSQGVVHIYVAQGNPIYDYNNPQYICEEGDFGALFCYNYYPIIGYETISIFNISLRSFKVPSGRPFRTAWKNVEATYYINGIQYYWQVTHNNIADVFETVYYGSYAQFEGTVTFETYVVNYVNSCSINIF